MHISWQVWSTEWLGCKQCMLNICVSDDTEGEEARGEANIQRVSENQEQNKPPCCFSLPGCERHPALTALQMCDLTNVTDCSWYRSKIILKNHWSVYTWMHGRVFTYTLSLFMPQLWHWHTHTHSTVAWRCILPDFFPISRFSQGHRWRDSVHVFTYFQVAEKKNKANSFTLIFGSVLNNVLELWSRPSVCRSTHIKMPNTLYFSVIVHIQCISTF